MENFKKLALYVRNKIELNKNKLYTSTDCGFNRFPNACCDRSSEILLKYLIDNNIYDFKIVSKYGYINGYDYSHVWLENNYFSVDITGDQFNGKINGITFDKIIVIEKENYYFNTINGEYVAYKGNFLEYVETFVDYLYFYNNFIWLLKNPPLSRGMSAGQGDL